MQDLLDRMTLRVLRHADGVRMETPLPRAGIGVVWPQTAPATPGCGSGACLVLQGAKRMLVGRRILRYEAGSCFASVIDLPTMRSTYEADKASPYVATSLKIDAPLLTELISEMPPVSAAKAAPSHTVAAVSDALLAAWDHYLALLDAPDDIPVLAAARERELVYRLLQSPHGPMLRQIASGDSRLSRIRKVIEWIRRNFDQSFSARDLAEMAGMSVPSFNRHFRAVTATSPLQYQKTMRLQAARRLLSVEGDATGAAFAVGYESASQFSREYARHFGLPPKKDALVLRSGAGSTGSTIL